MMNQLPVKRCQHCGGEDIRVGWQSDALVTFKRNGLLGNRIKYLICGNCGAILYQCVAQSRTARTASPVCCSRWQWNSTW